MVYNCFEQIYNNYLSSCYLNILVKVKNPNEALKIIYRSVENVLMMEYHLGTLLNIKDKLYKYALNQQKKYILDNKIKLNKIDILSINTEIPSILYLLNFDIYKMFNDIDNQILINILIFKKDIKDIECLLSFSEEYILFRYQAILNHIKNIYINKVKQLFLNELNMIKC